MIDLLRRYNKESFLDIIKLLIPDFQSDEQLATDHSGTFQEVQRLGISSEFALEVFCIKISGSANRRIGITTDSFKLLRRYSCRRAVIAYWSDNEHQWRISLLSATHKIVDGKLTTEFSNPRRHSYLVGPETKVATPTLNLIKKGTCGSFEDLEQRFALEVVNKEFYSQIAMLYTKLVGGERKSGTQFQMFDPLISMPQSASAADRHEFGVRLLGRIIFCWFLKQKKGSWGVSLLPESVIPVEISAKNDIYEEILEPLFYEVLNVPKEFRKKKYRNDDLDLVPYLNGGLFEPVLGNAGDHYSKGSLLSIPDSWFQELFRTLNTYSFTIDENTSFDVELSVDPEMLGRIFENLLAEINPDTGESARKATGSFYTPRVVVEYMVDRTLSLYLQKSTSVLDSKIDALISYDKTDDLENPLSDEEKNQIVKSVNRFTALDPACGSGAFPMGLLQKLVYILQEVDPDCSKWIDEQCSVLPREIRKRVRNSLEVKGIDYVRKLGVIRQCIYGVDIQPVATEISRLRCFLTLIVDENVDDMKENRGIEPLPNLEFKFVTANSLLSLERISELSKQDSLFGNNDHIEELAGIRNTYFGAVSEEKELIRSEFRRVQSNMRRGLTQTKSEVSSKYEKLAKWQPFSLEPTNWFDSKWMFGLDEFSVVLANPPYLGEKGHKEIFAILKEGSIGKFYSKNMDLFYFFFHQAINLVAPNGHIAFITTNYYPTATFARVLRTDMKNRTSAVELINFNELRIFEAAPGQHNLITILEKSDDDLDCRVVVAEKKGVASQATLRQVLEGYENVSFASTVKGSIFEGEEAYIRFSVPEGASILERLSDLPHLLGDVCAVRQGLHANPDKYKKSHKIKYPRIDANDGDGIFVLNQLESKKFTNSAHLKPFYKNSDISKFGSIKYSDLSIIYLTRDLKPSKEETTHLQKFRDILETRREVQKQLIPWYSLHWPREQYMFEGPKIVCPQRSNLNTFGYNDGSWYASADVYFIKESDSRFPLKCVLGILNSRLYFYWLYHRGKRKGEMLELYQVPLSEIPLPNLSAQAVKDLSLLVSRCIELASKGKSLEQAEGLLNEFVYEMFELTSDEIRVIDAAYDLAQSRRSVKLDDEEEDLD
jgi:adenine-specific DNA-methyltransferase